MEETDKGGQRKAVPKPGGDNRRAFIVRRISLEMEPCHSNLIKGGIIGVIILAVLLLVANLTLLLVAKLSPVLGKSVGAWIVITVIWIVITVIRITLYSPLLIIQRWIPVFDGTHTTIIGWGILLLIYFAMGASIRLLYSKWQRTKLMSART